MKFLPYVLRNVFRNKIRTLFTSLSIAISLFLVALLYSYMSMQEELGSSTIPYNRLVVMHANGLTNIVPVAHVDRVAALEGVQVVTPFTWFGGTYGDDKIFFAQFGCDPKTVTQVFEEYKLTPDELQAWQKDKTGCVIGAKLARMRGWKVGDKVPLKSGLYDCTLELIVRGIYDAPKAADQEMLWFHWDYLDEERKKARDPLSGNVGTIMLKVSRSSSLPDVAARINERFASSDAPVKALTEQAFNAMFMEMMGDVKGFIEKTTMAVVFSLICVAANSMAMSMRERTREVAVLKALGFGRWLVISLVLAEAATISMFGGLLGLLGAKLLFSVVDLSLMGLPGLSQLYVPWMLVLQGTVLSVFIGLVSGIVPAFRAADASVVDGLRRVV